MKKLIYILSCMAALLSATLNMKAQTCNDNFTVSTQITPSTCQANGKIVVMLADTVNLINIQYGLKAVNGDYTVIPGSSNVFDNLSPGSYNLTVQAFCPDDDNWSTVKNIYNVVVGGNYQAPQASLNSTSSRNSYPDCAMGIIALTVTGGNGAFTFSVHSAPTGAPKNADQIVTATPGTSSNSNVYTLEGQNWPAGNYEIDVADSCYSTRATFTLNPISGFPTFSSPNYAGFRPNLDNLQGDCNVVGWYAYSSLFSANPDYQRFLSDSLYEIGSAPLVGGVAPPVNSVTNWAPWTSNGATVWLNLGDNINKFYGNNNNTIAIYTRVKNCSSASGNFIAFIRLPSISTSQVTYLPSMCDTIQTSVWTDYDGMLCYPLTLTVTQGGNTIYTQSDWRYNQNRLDKIPVKFSNGSYIVTYQDQNGTSMSLTTTPTFSFSRQIIPNCNDYNYYYFTNVTGAPVNCYPWLAIVKATKASTGTVVGIDTLYNAAYKTSPYKLQYDTLYNLSVQYGNGNTTTYSNISQSSTLTPTFTLAGLTACAVNSCYLYIYGYYWPAGTVFDVTGPNGFTSSTTIPSLGTNSVYVPSTAYTTLTPGTYTATYYLGGDMSCPKTITYDFPGAYNYTNFGYTQQQSCGGMEISPTGTVTYLGTPPTTPITYFRLVNGPAGYSTAVMTPGGSVTLNSAGTYVLGIMQSNSITGCTIATDTIVYTVQPLALDANVTSAYVCVGKSIGDISVSAANGVAPYTYSLWDESNTVRLAADTVTNGIAHFNYGSAGSTYTVRVSDNCGSSFNQKVSLNDLKTPRIVYSLDQNACTGDSVRLNCITLGTTTYTWTGPNGYRSTTQNPVIANVDTTMTGLYKVSVTPEYCGDPVEDSIYIRVYPPLMAGAVVTANREICAGTALTLSCEESTGGSGSYTYQWQSSSDGVSGWTDISGAVNATYSPAALTQGTYYYRKETTDTSCGPVYSDPMTIVVKACFAPVNPNLRSLPKR